MDIQWYPGHMAKTKRELNEKLGLIDIVIELLDARIPISSKNPDIDTIAGSKKRIVVLNKSDLADEKGNQRWLAYYQKQEICAVLSDSAKGQGISSIYGTAVNLMQQKIEARKKKGVRNYVIRAMVVGIPNVGKSTFINHLLGKNYAKTEDRPGVTKKQQWIKIKKGFELLDTPGILWPKFEDENAGIHLAATGAIKDQILDAEMLACHLIQILRYRAPLQLSGRYKIELHDNAPNEEILEAIAKSRGYLLKGGVPALDKAAAVLLDEFRSGKLGRLTLELPE